MASAAVAPPSPARERLLDAAATRLLEGGPASLVLDAVARDAGVSKGGLLYHFPSKAALVSGLLERMRASLDAAQADRAAADPAPGRWTRAYLETTVDDDGAPADSSARLMAAILACLGGDAEHLASLRDGFARWQARLQADGLDPVTATVVRLAVDGLWLSQLLGLPSVDAPLLRDVRVRLAEMTRP